MRKFLHSNKKSVEQMILKIRRVVQLSRKTCIFLFFYAYQLYPGCNLLWFFIPSSLQYNSVIQFWTLLKLHWCYIEENSLWIILDDFEMLGTTAAPGVSAYPTWPHLYLLSGWTRGVYVDDAYGAGHISPFSLPILSTLSLSLIPSPFASL